MFFRFELNVLRAFLNFDRNYDVLQDKSLDIPFKRILSMANDCSCAMVYLHRLFVLKPAASDTIYCCNAMFLLIFFRLLCFSASPPILHRDLKAENLLVDANWTVKVRLKIQLRFCTELFLSVFFFECKIGC